MSTIVAVKKKGEIVIGADTITVQGKCLVPSRYKKDYKKIHKINDSYIGIVGITAHHLVIESIKRKYSEEINLHSADAIFETLLKLHEKLKDEYYVNVYEEKEQEYESNQLHGLVVNPQGIFEIQSYREVIEYSEFWAIGSGCDFALGAFYSIYDSDYDASKIAEVALNASCEFDNGTGLPLDLCKVKSNR